LSTAVSVADNGLAVVSEDMPGSRSFALGFWVGTGSVDEPAEIAGASHFLEHLLFKGSPRRTAKSIALAVDAVGGDMNAYTTKEYTSFYIKVPSRHSDMAVELLSEIFWDPALRQDELECERQVIMEEILMHADEPADLVHEVLAQAMFPDHPLGREVLGDKGSVSAMTPELLRDFHRRHYVPGNTVVAAAGQVDHEWLVRRVLGVAPAAMGGRPTQRVPPAAPPGSTVAVRRPGEQAHLAIGLPGPGRDDEDRHAMGLVEHVLGGGMSSRLFQAVREERGLAYSVYSYRMDYEGIGAVAVYAGSAPSNLDRLSAVVNDELDRLVEGGISEEELEGARGYAIGSLVLGLEDSGSRMSRMGHSQLVHGRVRSLEEVEQTLASLTLEQVNAVASRWLSGPRTVAVVGPQ